MRARVLPLLAAVLVGCSAETGGTPVAEPSAPGSSGAPSARPVSLAEVDPCALLTEEIAVEVGVEDVGAGRPSKISRGCGWFVDNWGQEGDAYTVAISVDETRGLDDLPSDLDRTPLTVGSREAVQVETYDVCSIIMYVSESSRADASAVGSDTSTLDEFDSCRMALRLAELIEPALPLE